MSVHLSTHSHYSLLDGLPQIPALVDKAASFGMKALALTDRNNLYGAIEFYKTCEKKEVKPILGVDLDCDIAGTPMHLIFLAEHADGWRNLVKLVSAAHTEEKGRVSALPEHLEKWHGGLIVLVPESALRSGGKRLAEWLVSTFGKEYVYARLGWNGTREERSQSAERAREAGLSLVAADGVYYLDGTDRDARDVVRRIADPTASADGNDRAFASPAALEERYREFPDALKHGEEIAKRVDIKLKLGSWVFPNFPIPEGATYEAELEKLVAVGVKERGIPQTPEVLERIRYELSVINEKGFAPYFLTVADLLSFARRSGILTTTRGSAAGSLVSYATGITTIDPIAYQLPFERFLNPERPKAPDIDMDFADNRRDEMLAYAKEKYGESQVAQIGTFGTMMARAAVRDIARSLGYSYGVGDRIAKLIPFGSQGFPMTIDHALEIEEELREVYRGDEDAEIIINTAKRIEGNARHISIHAAGIVIAPSPVTDFVPVQYDPHGGSIITQYNMHAVEDAGLLKFDFLGLTILSILENAVKRLEERTARKVDIENIPQDDAMVFAMLGRGETEGVFQLGGGGMTRYLKELEPSSIHDINAMVALYRPGPMESIPDYIARKKNPARISYLDPRMEKILDRSYGIITYQDDVLLIAIEIAGYSWLEADNLRKAMGKKIPAEMEAQKEKFIEGAVNHGKVPRVKAEAIWKLIEPFAAYGFNKAHAASYGKVAYQTAYMKCHFPADYMAALMEADAGAVEKIGVHVAECARLGIRVLPPDVNESDWTFTVVDDTTIRFGLNSIKNFGEGGARAIITERKGGQYESAADLLFRVPGQNLNRRGLESLIKAGALDRFGDRKEMLEKIDELLSLQGSRHKTPEHQGALFALESKAPRVLIRQDDVTPLSDKLVWERELLGIYVSGHPTEQHRETFDKYPHSIQEALKEDRNGFPLIVGGVIESSKSIITKKGDRMAFFTIADREASIEAVAFPKTYQESRGALEVGSCVLIKGKVSRRNDRPSILIDKVKKLG